MLYCEKSTHFKYVASVIVIVVLAPPQTLIHQIVWHYYVNID